MTMKTILTIPTNCPLCGHELIIETSGNGTENLICPNKDCQGKLINRLDHFCSKKGLDIKGISKATLTKLVDWGFIDKVSDVLLLRDHRDAWLNADGFGKKSVDKILDEIDRVRAGSPLDKFICAIGIPMISAGTMKDILKYVDSYEDLRNKVKDGFNFSIIPNFGAAMAKSICEFDYADADIAASLINITPYEITKRANDSLCGLAFVITGKLKSYKNRAALVSEIEENGGTVMASVGKTTDFLIANAPEDTAKYKKAISLNIPIITEEDFIERRFNYEEE